MDGLKEKDNTKLKRDIISNKKFEPLYNEEELNGSFLIKDYDGVEEDPIIIDDTLLNDNSKNLKIEKMDKTNVKKIIRRKKNNE